MGETIGKATLLVAVVLSAGCSDLARPNEEMPAPEVNLADKKKRVANYFKQTFKDRVSYDSFEISDFRWVNSLKGWTWLVCVRFQDHGFPRTYALFMTEAGVVDSRYAVQTDTCNTQAYAPFDEMGSAKPVGLAPVH